MSRSIFLSMTEGETTKYCTDKKVDVSVIEPLPDGGVRLVCSSRDGADFVRAKLKKFVISDDTRRSLIRPRSPLW